MRARKKAPKTGKSSDRQYNEFERLLLQEKARVILQSAERAPAQTLTMLYGSNRLEHLTAEQLYDFINRANEKRLWNDPRLQNLTRAIGYKPKGEA